MATTTDTKAQNIAALERQLKQTKSDVLKKALQSKIDRLKEQAEDETKSASKLAQILTKQRAKIKEMTAKNFSAFIKRLSSKPEYAFLKSYTKDEVIRDIQREAKPVGWRFKGRGNYKIPSKKAIEEGKVRGTVYKESRPKRSDVSYPAKLARGGFVGKGEMVWKKISSSKKAEFLYENFTPEITPRSQEILVGKAWNFLPNNVKIKFEATYANVENYAKGGSTDFGMLSVKAGYDNNPKPTYADKIAGAKMGKMARGGKVGDFEVGQSVTISRDNDNENYADYVGKELVITHKAVNSREHRGFDESMTGQGLYDFVVRKTGEEVPFSLYDYEIEQYAKGGSISHRGEAHRMESMAKGGGVGKHNFKYEIFAENTKTGEKSIVAYAVAYGDVPLIINGLQKGVISSPIKYGFKSLTK